MTKICTFATSNNKMKEKQQNGTRFDALLNRLEKRLSSFGKRINIVEKETVSRLVNDTEEDEILEMIRTKQGEINGEIRFRAHQPFGAITKFERSNLVVSLSEDEEQHKTEIFKPFIEKGYAVTALEDYEPFGGYHVYLVSWK